MSLRWIVTVSMSVVASAAIAGCGAIGSAPSRAQPHRANLARVRGRVARERCFGAASANPVVRCSNPGLRLLVIPTPAEAADEHPGARCARIVHRGLVRACFWGAAPSQARRTVALIGDSHASHWRPALRFVVAAEHWRAVSITRAGCPLTLARPRLPGRSRRIGCMAWNGQVQRWLIRHPAIGTVFVAAHRGTVMPERGLPMRAAQRAGYAAAIRALLRHHVRHVIVIRDTPRNAGGTLACIERAVAASRPPGLDCAVPRAYALRSDPLATAAREMRSRHVQVIDLSGLLCGPAACPPVIGGVLVRRDTQHMTDLFSATLGPYLLHAVQRLTAGWRP